jgi:hypothetical protein
MARKNDGACANPKQIRTDIDCRAGRVEPRQDFRHDWRRSLSLRHAGREQARHVETSQQKPHRPGGRHWDGMPLPKWMMVDHLGRGVPVDPTEIADQFAGEETEGDAVAP